MIRNAHEVEHRKREYAREHPLTLEEKYAVLNAMYQEVNQLDRLPPRRGEGVRKHKISIARILNAGV